MSQGRADLQKVKLELLSRQRSHVSHRLSAIMERHSERWWLRNL